MDFDYERYKPVPVRYELRYVMLQKLRMDEDPLPDIQGREETKHDLIRAVLSNSHPYLVSREGTGKTRLAESLAKLLPPVPKIKDCPYNCDPKWPEEYKCPSCRGVKDPDIEFISGKERYSRIQGNEYTNEAKILGVKDIQAIVKGDSPTDPRAFIGTGVLRGNRGIVVVDELPAIPTKVQVLFHPILQENKIILEEYAWERPIDIFFIATGNPTGFAHVNRIPEPLLDRLELIPMGLPAESIERDIMYRERFRVIDDPYSEAEFKETEPLYIELPSLKRQVAAPWWIVELIVKATRYTRECPNIDRGASLRGSIRSLDHTYSSAEMRKINICSISDALQGLNLALRGRVRIRADLIGFDDTPGNMMSKNNEVIEDVMHYAVHNIGEKMLSAFEGSQKELIKEVDQLVAVGIKPSESLIDFPNAAELLLWIHESAPSQPERLINSLEDQLSNNLESVDPEISWEYYRSALEIIANLILSKDSLSYLTEHDLLFVPKRMET